MAKKLLIGFFLIGAFSMIAMSSHYLRYEISGILQGKSIARELWYQISFKAHVLFGIIAMSTGPWQFLNGVKPRLSKVHKRLGYIYTFSVFISSIAGLIVAQYAYGGLSTMLGFSMMAVVWFSTLYIAIKSIQNGDLTNHMKWMYINYGLTFAAITQRTWLLSAFVFDIPFLPVYQTSSWFPWMINMLIAYYLFKKSFRTVWLSQ